MNLIPLDAIQVPTNRQRREHNPEAHQDLITSIQSTGLLQPPVLRVMPNGTFALVCGERRLRAIAEIYELGGEFHHGQALVPEGRVPYLNFGDLSPLQAERAELEENIRRKDLTWQEQAEAEARILALLVKEAAADPAAPYPSAGAVAATTGASAPVVSRNLILANNLHRPDVARAKSAPEAMKILKRAEETERNAELAEKLGKEFLGAKHRLFHTNSLGWLVTQPDNEYDVVCTDPPYGMGADEFGDSGGGAEGAHFYEDSVDSLLAIMEVLPFELFRVTKPDAHVYLFCDIDQFHSIRSRFAQAGWTPFRTPILWYKPSAFRAPWPEHGPQRKYECILYARKGDLKCVRLAGDVITCQPDDNLGHQAQKPVALFQDLLARSVRPGMKVLDPFCGTGPIFPAAHALSAVATGIELDPAAFAIAATRIAKLKEPM